MYHCHINCGQVLVMHHNSGMTLTFEDRTRDFLNTSRTRIRPSSRVRPIILWKIVLAIINWAASSEFGTYRLCEQRRFRRAWASAQSRQNLRCSLIQAMNQEEPSDRKPDSWPLWMAGHAQLKFVMTECSKTQIRLTRLNWSLCQTVVLSYTLSWSPEWQINGLNKIYDWSGLFRNKHFVICKHLDFNPLNCARTHFSFRLNNRSITFLFIFFFYQKIGL